MLPVPGHIGSAFGRDEVGIFRKDYVIFRQGKIVGESLSE